MRKKSATVAQPAPAQPAEQAGATGTPAGGAAAGNGKPVSPDEVRVRAYQMWEKAGKPGGDGVNFWVAAEQELLQAR
jgi:hypothetical protein